MYFAMIFAEYVFTITFYLRNYMKVKNSVLGLLKSLCEKFILKICMFFKWEIAKDSLEYISLVLKEPSCCYQKTCWVLSEIYIYLIKTFSFVRIWVCDLSKFEFLVVVVMILLQLFFPFPKNIFNEIDIQYSILCVFVCISSS